MDPTINVSDLNRKQIKIDPTLKPISIATGGLITKSGLAEIHQGELMMDNQAANMMSNAAQVLSAYLPTSGQALNQLERDKISQSNGGGTVIANTDASTKQTVVNNYNGSNISPKAQMLSGETFAKYDKVSSSSVEAVIVGSGADARTCGSCSLALTTSAVCVKESFFTVEPEPVD